MQKTLIVLSLMMIGLSGCYVRGHDEGHRRDRGHYDERDYKRAHDDRHDDRKDDRGDRNR